jgi:hypothetical protein
LINKEPIYEYQLKLLFLTPPNLPFAKRGGTLNSSPAAKVVDPDLSGVEVGRGLKTCLYSQTKPKTG